MKFARVTACRLNEALMKRSTYLYDAAPSLYESVHRHLNTCAFTAIVAVACFALAQPVRGKGRLHSGQCRHPKQLQSRCQQRRYNRLHHSEHREIYQQM